MWGLGSGFGYPGYHHGWGPGWGHIGWFPGWGWHRGWRRHPWRHW